MTLETRTAVYRRPTTVGKIYIRTVVVVLAGAVVFMGADRQPAYKPTPDSSPYSVAVTHVCGNQVCRH